MRLVASPGRLTKISGGLVSASACALAATGPTLLSSTVLAILATARANAQDCATGNGTISSSLSSAQAWSQSSNCILTSVGAINSTFAGTYMQTAGALTTGNNVGTLSNSGTIAGTLTSSSSYEVGMSGLYNYNSIDSITNLTGGLINGTYAGTPSGFNDFDVSGIRNLVSNGTIGSIGTITNAGQISASNSATLTGPNGATFTAIANDAIIGVIDNTGTISVSAGSNYNDPQNSGYLVGVLNAEGSIGTLSNAAGALITAPDAGLWNSTNATIDSLINAGTIQAGYYAVFNTQSSIVTFQNLGVVSGDLAGLANGGSIGTLVNSGLITGTSTAGIENSGGVINTLTNALLGTISSANGTGMVNNGGTILTLGNLGIIGGATGGINNSGDIGSLTNNGTISSTGTGNGWGLLNSGSIGSIVNNANGVFASSGNGGGISNSSTGSIGSLLNDGSIVGISNSGSIQTLTNNGILSGTGLFNSGTLSAVTNNGSIIGMFSGVINNTGGSIGTFTNSVGASIYGTSVGGFGNGGTIGALTNSGTLAGIGTGLSNSGTINSLINTGTGVINGVYATGLYNTGSLGSLSNTGTISGNGTAGFAINNQGTIGTVTNSGLIVSSGANGLENGTLGNITAVDNTGTIAGNGQRGLNDQGTIGTVNNSGLISGSAVGLNVDPNGSLGTLTNTATGTITGGYVGVNLPGQGSGGYLGLLSNAGVISGASEGVSNDGSIGTLSNSGQITGTFGVNNIFTSIDLLANSGTIQGGSAAVNNTGTIGALSNSGLLTGGVYALNNSGTIGSFNNTGTLINTGAGSAVLLNSGSIGTLTNSGMIGAAAYAIENTGSIGSLVNGAGGSILSGTSDALVNSGIIGTLTNNGVINGDVNGLNNSGTITSLINTGTLADKLHAGLNNTGSIGSLDNFGVISGVDGIANHGAGAIGAISNTGTILGTSQVALYSSATISGVDNSGLISGAATGIKADSGSTLGSLTNSGTISGPIAIAVAATGAVGTITNSGTIAGTIENLSGSDLTIVGGGGSISGLLTGASGGYGAADVGTITNTASNLYFGSGNILLNDNVNVGSGTLNNAAQLQINNPLTLTGNYHQVSGGALISGVTSLNNYGSLTVSGTATMDANGHIGLMRLNGFTFAAGQTYTLVVASSANYNVDTMTAGISGYSGSAIISSVQSGGSTELQICLANSQGQCAAQATSGGSGGNTGTTPPHSSAGNTYSLATTSNAIASNNAVASYSGSNPALIQLANAVVALGSSAQANRAGNQLQADGQGAAMLLAMEPALDVLNLVTAHADETRLAQAFTPDGSGIAAGENGAGWATWTEGLGGGGHQSTDGQFAGYGLTTEGFLYGVDHGLGDSARAGALVSYTHAKLDDQGDRGGDTTGLDAYGLFGYGSFLGQHAYLDLSAGLLRDHFNTVRVIDFSGFSGVAYGSHEGLQSLVKVDGGYPIALSRLPDTSVTPVWSLAYGHLHQDAYRESGGSAAALAVDSSDANSVKGELGARLEHSLQVGAATWVPNLHASWRHEFDHSQATQRASFVEDTTDTTSFTSEGPRPRADSAQLGAGLTVVAREGVTLALRYDAEAAAGYFEQSGRLRLRWEF